MKNLKHCLQPIARTNFESAALCLLRLIVGLAFIFHGSGKIQAPFGWMPPGGPMSIPPFFQFLAAISEFGGGIALIFGIVTPLASLGIASVMSVAVYMHMIVRHDPFVSSTGGMSYEPALGYLGVAILFIAMGPGKFSLDKLIFKERA